MLELIKANEQDEFLTYFPEYRDRFEEVEKQLEYTTFLIEKTLQLANLFITSQSPSRKDYASWVAQQKPELKRYLFCFYDGKRPDYSLLKYEDLFNNAIVKKV